MCVVVVNERTKKEPKTKNIICFVILVVNVKNERERKAKVSHISYICEENEKKKFQISLSLLNNNLIETTTNE